MGDEPRKHHFLPKFWLRGFTTNGKVEGRLNAINAEGKVYSTTPCNAGHRRDYYRIDRTDGGDEFIVEKTIDNFDFQSVLSSVLSSQQALSKEEFDKLLAFTALMAARGPSAHGAIESLTSALSQAQRAAEWSAKTGIPLPGLGPAPGATVFRVSPDELPLELSQNDWVRSIFESADTIYECLKRRHWVILIVDDRLPDFICSDCPVASVLTRTPGHAFDTPGFATSDTQITFPLSRQFALSSGCSLEVAPKPLQVDHADRAAIAKVNTKTLMHASQLFWATEDLVYEREDGCEGSLADLVRRWSR